MERVEKNSLHMAEQFHDTKDIEKRNGIVSKFLKETENSEGFQMPEFPHDCNWLNSSTLNLDDLVGKLVLLDFFTYCCINCIHMIPFVHKMESRYSTEDGLIVIGIHSAKFPNEKDSRNINKALERHNITHPVLNDHELALWYKLGIKCWPTFVIVSPSGQVILSLPGEAHADVVEAVIVEAFTFYECKISQHKITPSFDAVDAVPTFKEDYNYMQLKYPGKVELDPSGSRLAIADTGNNRVVVCSLNGDVLHVIGGSKGRKDGDYSQCSFNSPQGLSWCGANSIYVADCDNHLIRKIDLLVKRVVTIAGTGRHGNDFEGGKQGTEQPICSPWAVQVAGSPRFPQNQSILYIAMSGLHQIWAFFLQDADWQKGSEYKMGTCLRCAGNGQEENRNNSYPHKAGFAQPSGLAVDVDAHKLYVADSESSTIRRVNLANGSVEGLVGGHFDPTNLFAFGDEDGKARNARLQHPLDVAWDRKRSRLYVADSYNHKIKVVDPSTKICSTLCGPDSCKIKDASSLGYPDVFPPVQLNEPGGICVDASSVNLYIADTNHHRIKVLNLSNGECSELKLHLPQSLTECDSVTLPKPARSSLVNHKRALAIKADPVTVCATETLQLNLKLGGVNLTDESPSQWQLMASLQGDSRELGIMVNSGIFRKPSADLSLSIPIPDLLATLLLSRFSLSGDKLAAGDVTFELAWEANLYFCAGDSNVCSMKGVVVKVPVTVAEAPTSRSQPLTVSVSIPLKS